MPVFFKLYAWGSNNSGQLKQADAQVSAKPAYFRVSFWSLDLAVKQLLIAFFVIKLILLHLLAHTVQSSCFNISFTPSRNSKKSWFTFQYCWTLQVGNHSFILDAYASNRLTAVIVGGVANYPTLYVFGARNGLAQVILPEQVILEKFCSYWFRESYGLYWF